MVTARMKTMYDAIVLGEIGLANRFVMAPMTRARAGADGRATALMAQYYAQRASAGLIVTEGIQPNPVGQGYAGTPGLHTAAQLDSWRAVTGAVHAAGGRIVAQLTHTGRIGHPELHPGARLPVGPSAVAAEGKIYTAAGLRDYPVPLVLRRSEIAATIADFAAAARNAIAAGFDGVEIHAGSGFLLHQFLSENANRRGDEYGGCLAGRVSLTADVADAVALAIGAGRTGLRISPASSYNDIAEGDTAGLYRELLARLPRLAYLHVMEAHSRLHTVAIRRQWRGALILNPHAVPGVGAVTPATANAVLDCELADAVSFGALFLANPDLPARVRAGGPYNLLDQHRLYGGGARGYTDYPLLRIEEPV